MPSGYEKSPDYSGPPPTTGGLVLGVLALAAIVVTLFFVGG
jgi:hypothetical protein